MTLKESDFYALPAPLGFGEHPNFSNGRIEWIGKNGLYSQAHPPKKNLAEFYNPLHPSVFVVPRNEFYNIDDSEGIQELFFPFSSNSFYLDMRNGVYRDLSRSKAFRRLKNIGQLGFLISPRPIGIDPWIESEDFPRNTRQIHSLLVVILADVVLARNGFTLKERAPAILAAGCHDIGTPAGGDSVKRVDPTNLDEELNFSWILKECGLAKRWKEKYGFSLTEAQKMVKNLGPFGKLLDIVDKIAYTAWDCYYIGLVHSGKIRNFCIQHPLVMDIWQDIKLAKDGSFAFSDPEKLYNFLLLRAYEFQEVLYNPASKIRELYLRRFVESLYDKGRITKEQLLIKDDRWLGKILEKYFPEIRGAWRNPPELSCQKLQTLEAQQDFLAKIGNRAYQTEYIPGFSSGLDWQLVDRTYLKDAISKEKVQFLEEIVKSTEGYYVYYQNETS